MSYIRFGMCPFSVASIGGGLTIQGMGSESYTWTHYPCLGENCKLWIHKINPQGEVYARGCAMQFAGLTQDEIVKDLQIKENSKIKEAMVTITNVRPKSKAEQAGIKVDDAILSVCGKNIKNSNDAEETLHNSISKSEPVKIELIRNGKIIVVELIPNKNEKIGINFK